MINKRRWKLLEGVRQSINKRLLVTQGRLSEVLNRKFLVIQGSTRSKWQRKFTRAEHGESDAKNIDKGKTKTSHDHIRICVINTATDEESTAAGNQLCSPEPLLVLK